MNFIVNFGRRKFSGVISDRMKNAIFVWLKKDGGNGEIGGVRYYSTGKVWVEMLEEGSCGECRFESFKRMFSRFGETIMIVE